MLNEFAKVPNYGIFLNDLRNGLAPDTVVANLLIPVDAKHHIFNALPLGSGICSGAKQQQNGEGKN